jgi:hypothetical protein
MTPNRDRQKEDQGAQNQGVARRGTIVSRLSAEDFTHPENRAPIQK